MSKFKKRNRVLQINTRLNEMADLLEAEKRALTPDEKVERDALIQEKEILQLRMERESRGVIASEEEASNERTFARIVDAIYRRKPLDPELESIVANGNELDIPRTRSEATIQDTASAQPLIPLTIGDIIQPLEKGLILDKVGVKMQYGLVGEWALPVVGSVEATIEGENTEVSDSKIDISKLSPKPKRVALSIPVSNRAIDQSNHALLEIVRTQMTMGLTRLLNKWMFSPTKITVSASNGCFVEAVKKPTVISKTASFSWKDVLLIQAEVMKKGVVFDGTGAYVCSASTFADLKSTPRDAGSGRMVLEDGKIDGYPVYVTEYFGEEYLGFGVFSYELVGQFGKMRMIVDPYTGAKKNYVYFVLNTDFDMLTIRPEAFAVGKRTVEVVESEPGK